ncbi:MAG TPA: CRISPR-associated endonuclease Cas2 [Anaerolineaceae bacterium]|nr:CRISPR-associated endonuclease Cas2 [Anaerolineaceae bacterium]
MLIIITYDVNTELNAGKKRLRMVAKACKNYGQRVQDSVFECIIDNAAFTQLRINLEKIIDPEKDSLRYYILGNEWKGKVIHVGVKRDIDLQGLIIA